MIMAEERRRGHIIQQRNSFGPRVMRSAALVTVASEFPGKIMIDLDLGEYCAEVVCVPRLKI